MKLKENIVWAVIGPVDEFGRRDYPRSFGYTEFDAWINFFKANAHSMPTGEAQKAYKAIGYDCKEFKMVEI